MRTNTFGNNNIFHMLVTLTSLVTILELRSFIFFLILVRVMSLTTLVVTKKIVNGMRIMGRGSTFVNDSGST